MARHGPAPETQLVPRDFPRREIRGHRGARAPWASRPGKLGRSEFAGSVSAPASFPLQEIERLPPALGRPEFPARGSSMLQPAIEWSGDGIGEPQALVGVLSGIRNDARGGLGDGCVTLTPCTTRRAASTPRPRSDRPHAPVAGNPRERMRYHRARAGSRLPRSACARDARRAGATRAGSGAPRVRA